MINHTPCWCGAVGAGAVGAGAFVSVAAVCWRVVVGVLLLVRC